MPSRDSMGLIGHEFMHSWHADMMTGTMPFLIGYATDSAAAYMFEGDSYRRNVSEMFAHAMQHTIDQLLAEDPNLMSSVCNGQSSNLNDRIRARFLSNLSQEMQR